ncbi:hypothetical protein SAMD00019534_015070 [Acytostelium subglobosum LB1]|uniref:hypothetical protein n=1 Tax=Acytostelium subglobosum LB1 TaxID=1410327 RepID=UPI000644BB49|nr:hypothetical protein SAMD00019534_015070 [Acytostelium subglobosum LB1]GAM18332.1 hypothetical protein SAMD00019534_015070 [Acytostelium subglobosum LB1]|eukprot:XP_012757552.1 hypothetical protein SAMD00019534_015070 [Acytostelium subglobosum LB1]
MPLKIFKTKKNKRNVQPFVILLKIDLIEQLAEELLLPQQSSDDCYFDIYWRRGSCKGVSSELRPDQSGALHPTGIFKIPCNFINDGDHDVASKRLSLYLRKYEKKKETNIALLQIDLAHFVKKDESSKPRLYNSIMRGIKSESFKPYIEFIASAHPGSDSTFHVDEDKYNRELNSFISRESDKRIPITSLSIEPELCESNLEFCKDRPLHQSQEGDPFEFTLTGSSNSGGGTYRHEDEKVSVSSPQSVRSDTLESVDLEESDREERPSTNPLKERQTIMSDMASSVGSSGSQSPSISTSLGVPAPLAIHPKPTLTDRTISFNDIPLRRDVCSKSADNFFKPSQSDFEKPSPLKEEVVAASPLKEESDMPIQTVLFQRIAVDEEKNTYLNEDVILNKKPEYMDGVPVSSLIVHKCLFESNDVNQESLMYFEKVIQSIGYLSLTDNMDKETSCYWLSNSLNFWYLMNYMYNQRIKNYGVALNHPEVKKLKSMEYKLHGYYQKFWKQLWRNLRTELDEVLAQVVHSMDGKEFNNSTIFTDFMVDTYDFVEKRVPYESVCSAIFKQVFNYTSGYLCNLFLCDVEHSNFEYAINVKLFICSVTQWISEHNQIASFVLFKSEMFRILQLLNVLMIDKQSLLEESTRKEICPSLRLTQLAILLLTYNSKNQDDEIDPSIIKSLQVQGIDNHEAQEFSICLDFVMDLPDCPEPNSKFLRTSQLFSKQSMTAEPNPYTIQLPPTTPIVL